MPYRVYTLEESIEKCDHFIFLYVKNNKKDLFKGFVES